MNIWDIERKNPSSSSCSPLMQINQYRTWYTRFITNQQQTNHEDCLATEQTSSARKKNKTERTLDSHVKVLRSVLMKEGNYYSCFFFIFFLLSFSSSSSLLFIFYYLFLFFFFFLSSPSINIDKLYVTFNFILWGRYSMTDYNFPSETE